MNIFPGLLVAASMIRAPEGTFGAAVAEVGVHDLLKVISDYQML
jgi:prolyl oligopeptidase PreP (S9A serine peptidase family)